MTHSYYAQSIRQRRWSALAVTAVLGLLTGCGDDSYSSASPETESPGITTIASAKPRAIDVQVTNRDTETLVDGNTGFALRLYDAVREGNDGNFFYSPYSISLALAMTYAGARGDTEQEMSQTLGFSLAQGELHAALNALDQTLASYGQRTEEGEEGSHFTLNIANSIWDSAASSSWTSSWIPSPRTTAPACSWSISQTPRMPEGSSTIGLPGTPRTASRI